MTPQEVALQYIKEHSKYTVSVTKQITFYNAKECALITARELRNQYEPEHDYENYYFWHKVIIELNMMQP